MQRLGWSQGLAPAWALAAALGSLVLSACSDSTSVEDRLFAAFEGPLQFSVSEQLAFPGPGLPRIELEVEPVRGFGCYARLEGLTSTSGDRLIVHLDRVVDPTRGCDRPSTGIPYRPSLIAPLPSRPGEYPVRFELAGTSVDYTVVVSEDVISVAPLRASALDSVHTLVIQPKWDRSPRIQPWSFFFSCSAPGQDCEPLKQRLTQDVPATFDREPSFGLGGRDRFRYSDEMGFARARTILCAFVRDETTQMSVILTNWDGVYASASRSPTEGVSCR